MSVPQGSSYVSTFGPILDGSGAVVSTAVSGGDLTAYVFDPLNVDHSSDAVFAYIGAGLYRITVPISSSATVGEWAAAVTWDDGSNPAQHFSDSFEVTALTTTVVSGTTVAADATLTNSLKGIRRQVADLLGDLVIATATGNGLVSTFVDANSLGGPVGAFAGREAYFSGGTAANLGQSRYVISSATNGTLTFGADLPHATATGDEIELSNVRGQGWGVAAKNRAINMALQDAGAGAWATAQDTLGTAFSTTSPTLAIPADYAYVHTVEWQDLNGYWHEIPPALYADEPGWTLAPGRLIRVGGFWATEADTRTVRITGYERYAPLASDSDVTGVNIEWLRHQAAAYLLMQGRERSGDNSRSQLYLTYQGRADRLRDLVGGPPRSGTTAVIP